MMRMYKKIKLGKISFILGVMSIAIFGLYIILPELFPNTPSYYLANFVIFFSALFVGLASVAVGVVDLFYGKERKKTLATAGIVLGTIVIALGLIMLMLVDILSSSL